MFHRPAVSPSTYKMAAVLTSFLLLVHTTYYSHVSAATTPRPNCPIMCSCDGNRASCDNTAMTHVPQLPVDTSSIWLSENNITRIRANAFLKYDNLTELTLRSNNMRSIDERAFAGLSLLSNFHLLENLLLSFESGVFRYFSKVRLLVMRIKLLDVPHAEICRLKHLFLLTLDMFNFPSVKFDRCFEDLTKLKQLYLNRMKQSNISRATFRPFRFSLAQLHVTKCGLRNLDVDTFEDLSRLSILSLEENAINYLPYNIFTPLTRLTHLNIASNKLTVISDELLRPLQRLQYLFIEKNFHVNLTLGEAFLNMTRLRQINVNSIRLSSLNNDTFRYLRHCPTTNVDMSSCSLRTISTGAFLPLHNVTSLYLTANPLNGTVLRGAFYGLQGLPLRKLSLSTVNLNDYPRTLFEGLNDNNITTLELDGTYISVIKKGLFRNLGTIYKLDLSSNKLSTLEDHVFEDLVMLTKLKLDR